MGINLIIPAAGLGSRFQMSGVRTPKPLIEIQGIPMIAWVVANFELEPDDKIFIISQRKDKLPEKLDKFLSKFMERIQFVEINELTNGAATTLEFALNRITSANPVLSVNSDQYISGDLSSYLASVRAGECAGQILLMSAHGNKWSYVERDSFGKIVKVVEKIQVSDEATVGIYGWRDSQTVLESIKAMKNAEFRVNGEFYVAPSYNYLRTNDNLISSSNIGIINSDVHGLGTPEDLEIFLANPNLEKFTLDVRRNLGI